jgi:hypothetical protein
MNDCAATGKVAYHTKLDALQARTKISTRVRRSRSKRPVYEREPYRCPYCKLWHLTSSPQ